MQILRNTAGLLSILGSLLILMVGLLVTVDVVLRIAFNATIATRGDLEQILIAIGVTACMPLTFLLRRNISVHLGTELLNRTRILGAPIRCAVAGLLSSIFMLIASWQLARYALSLHANGEQLPIARYPSWPFWTVIAFFTAVGFLCAIASIRRPKQAGTQDP